MELHPLTLKFLGGSADMEAAYRAENIRGALHHNRAALIVGILFYSAFGILDALIMPEIKSSIWYIRFAVVGPLAALAFLASFTRIYKRYACLLMACVSILAGTGIIVMIMIAPTPVNYSYYAGLLLVFIWTYAIVRISFAWAAFAGWVQVVLYEIMAIWISPTPFDVLVSNNFFFIGANIMGMIAGYSLEYHTRRNFFLTRQLETERETISRTNRELKIRTLEYETANQALQQEVSERKRVERALKKSEGMYTTLVNAIPDIIVRTDLEGNIRFVNDYAIRISGYRREEVENQNFLIFIAPEDRNRAIENARRIAENKLSPREYRMMTRDGRQISFEVNGDFLLDEDGTAFGFVYVCRNITDRKRAEKEMTCLQKLQGTLEMARTICHEMNQPLQIISGLSQLMLMSMPEDDRNRKEVDIIKNQTDRMAAITKRLMTLNYYETLDYAGVTRILDIYKGPARNGKQKETS